MTVVGFPMVTQEASISAADGDFQVRLEEMDDGGKRVRVAIMGSHPANIVASIFPGSTLTFKLGGEAGSAIYRPMLAP